MTALFITGTGTDVGKTFVALALIAALRAQGRKVCAVKPVASGFDPAAPEASDSGRLLRALGRPLDGAALASVSPWRFAAPLSPDMAAAREGRRIDFDELVRFSARSEESDSAAEVTLIEGIGGVMVPLDERHTVLDWIEALRVPVLLVAGTYLGTLSHTLTAVHALESRGCAPAAVVLSESLEQPVPAEETQRVLRRFIGVRVDVLGRQTADEAAGSRALRKLIASVL
ncbi:MAG TPA: dethiobiotin synthase [Gammaproteobacteria bacterium]|nr:dethiobiotin synthase [Gammaproteobacteria bacterium]